MEPGSESELDIRIYYLRCINSISFWCSFSLEYGLKGGQIVDLGAIEKLTYIYLNYEIDSRNLGVSLKR